MDAEFLEEYLKSPEEHLHKFIDENYELRIQLSQRKEEIERLNAELLHTESKWEAREAMSREIHELQQKELKQLTAKHEALVKGLKFIIPITNPSRDGEYYRQSDIVDLLTESEDKG